MKRLAPLLGILFLASLIVGLFIVAGRTQRMVVVHEGNTSKQPIPMELNRYQDSDCGMVIDDLSYASQVVGPDGKTWFFHDHGGMAAWLQTKAFKTDAVIWVMDRKTQSWIDGRSAWYSRNEMTPMEYGFGAYSDSTGGRVGFEAMQRLMLRGETMANPAVRKQILESSWKP